MIRFGLLDSVPNVSGIVQPWFDKDKLTVIETAQIGWFDKTHTKCTIGGQKADKSKMHLLRFPRDKHGKLDMQASAYDETSDSGMYVDTTRAYLLV
jgi:hypothetical protein